MVECIAGRLADQGTGAVNVSVFVAFPARSEYLDTGIPFTYRPDPVVGQIKFPDELFLQ